MCVRMGDGEGDDGVGACIVRACVWCVCVWVWIGLGLGGEKKKVRKKKEKRVRHVTDPWLRVAGQSRVGVRCFKPSY